MTSVPQKKVNIICIIMTLIYLLIGSIFIGFYDKFLNMLINFPKTTSFFYHYKDWIFLLISSIAFYILTASYIKYVVKLTNRLNKTYRALKRYSEELYDTKLEYHRLAYFDELTGLPNRILFKDKIEKEIVNSNLNNKTFAVIYLDLDNFKTINDTLGHDYGDLLLKQVGELLIENFDENIVSRFGEDEFAILLTDISSKSDIKNKIDEIMSIFERTWVLDSREFFITASIGVVVYPENGETVNELITNADTSMYDVKQNGKRGYSYYSSAMREELFEKLEIEADLRQALINNEFILHYQPQVDIKTKDIIGLEALIRWNHPNKGLIPPNKFIPIAEETGLIMKIGEWVLRECARQINEWKDKGYKPVKIGINLSGKQFQNKNLVKMINNIINETNLDPNFIELEITESIAITNLALTTITLNQLRQCGIKISLDDFGTGYSSLNYLKQLPIDNLKMDRSFVKTIHKNLKEEAIAKTIIDLAHNLNLTVTAEGMEECEQLESLAKHNCDIAQGYLFSKPLPPDEIEKFIA